MRYFSYIYTLFFMFYFIDIVYVTVCFNLTVNFIIIQLFDRHCDIQYQKFAHNYKVLSLNIINILNLTIL
jgi:hypothetical protein